MVENAWGWGGSVCVSRNVKGLVMVEVDQAVEDRTGNRAGLSALNQHSDPLPRACISKIPQSSNTAPLARNQVFGNMSEPVRLFSQVKHGRL